MDEHGLFGGNPAFPEGAEGLAMLDRMNGGAHEQLASWGLSLCRLDPTAHVLDIGCGGGANLLRIISLCPRGHVTGIDPAPASLAKSSAVCAAEIERGACSVLKGNVTELPFDDASFDAATAFETVYFWTDPETAFGEVHRILRPGGMFLICNETDGTDRKAHEQGDPLEGMSIYTGEELERLLKGAGFPETDVRSKPGLHHIAVIAHA